MNQRLLVILIIGLIVLFIIAVVGGASNTNNQIDSGLFDDSGGGPLAALQVSLSLDDVDVSGSGCELLKADRILRMAEDSTCELSIPPARLPIGRTLRLSLLEGSGVNVLLEQPDADPPALDVERDFAEPDDVDDDGSIRLDIFSAGGRLKVLDCGEAAGCRIELG